MKQLRNYIDIRKKSSIIKVPDNKSFTIIREQLDKLGPDADLNHLDVSECKNFTGLFWSSHFSDVLNPDISKWNVSKVEYMGLMFKNCKKFNSDLSEWDLSSCRNTGEMFQNCYEFNQDLSNWDMHNVDQARGMFKSCRKFDQDLSKWQFHKLCDLDDIFEDCKIREEWKPLQCRK